MAEVDVEAGHDRLVMGAEDMARAIDRLADAIVASQPLAELAIVGIQRRGAVLAGRLARAIAARGLTAPPVGAVDIALYRDDLSEIAAYPIVRPTVLPGEVAGRTIILVDDVLYTGRTVRAAMGVLLDHGRPQAIRLVVLIDRGHRELPIRADLVGRNLPTARDEYVDVAVAEIDGLDAVSLGRAAVAPGRPPASAGAGGPGPG